MQFAGHQAVGCWRIAFEQFNSQLLCCRRPRLMACTAAALRLPEVLLGSRASKEVRSAQLVEGTFTQAQLLTGLPRINLVLAVKFKEMTHKVRGMTVMELARFFSDIARQRIIRPLLPVPLIPRGLRPQNPAVLRLGQD